MTPLRVLGFLVCALLGSNLSSADFWVSPTGSDANPGTQEKPLASLVTAQRKARELRRTARIAPEGGTRILLADGIHFLSHPLQFVPEDSGTAASPAIIEAAPGAKPQISGGLLLTHWRRPASVVPGLPKEAQGEVLECDAPVLGGRLLAPRQLWTNGLKATRAKTPKGDLLNRILSWDPQNKETSIQSSELLGCREPGRVEMIIHQQWAIAFLRVKALRAEGDRTMVKFEEPESRLEFEHPYPAPVMSAERGNAPYFLANAVEFLDEPGEWFQEMPSGRILYWPRKGENAENLKAYVPVLENLVRAAGTLDRPISHLYFKGIAFSHATWQRPSLFGHVPLQAGMPLLDSYKIRDYGTAYKANLDNLDWIGRPSASVLVANARFIRFDDCRFEQTGSAGLDIDSGATDILVQGCVFNDIGGNGLQVGKFADETVETHVPYNPVDEREISSRIRIANNLVTDCGTEDWGCIGICVGYAREVNIEHNEVSFVPYTGISLGWGWAHASSCLRDNRVHANYVHRAATKLCDTAAIYLLSSQPGTVVTENHIDHMKMSPYVFNPEHWFYLYLDEGSSHIQVRDNWCPSERLFANANGPGNIWQRNGPQVSEEIRKAAGLEERYVRLKGPKSDN